MDRRFDPLPFAFGGPLGRGQIRRHPDDFIIREQLGFEASGEGEHCLLHVRKRDANTKWIAKELARVANVRVREVGYSGLKDRHAIAEQYFTIPIRERAPDSWTAFRGEGFEVIGAARTRRKLRRGAHRANEFAILVRGIEIDHHRLDERLRSIAARGVPNYFGEQRFGVEEGNLDLAQRWFDRGETPVDRDARGFALSAARAALFNAVLGARIADGSWNRLLDGELVNLDGSNSIFRGDALDIVQQRRCSELDVHATGPLCGLGGLRCEGEALAIEETVLEPWKAWCIRLAELRVEAARRPLRVAVHDLRSDYSADVLALRFSLRTGAFATAVLREIIEW